MLDCDSDRIIVKLARLAAAADNGISAGHQGLVGPEIQQAHEASAKAYRHAIRLVIDDQRLSNSLARASEQ